MDQREGKTKICNILSHIVHNYLVGSRGSSPLSVIGGSMAFGPNVITECQQRAHVQKVERLGLCFGKVRQTVALCFKGRNHKGRLGRCIVRDPQRLQHGLVRVHAGKEVNVADKDVVRLDIFQGHIAQVVDRVVVL